MMLNNKNSVWSFKLDTVHSWAYLQNFLNDEECQKIIDHSKKIKSSKGYVKDNDQENVLKNSYRESDLKWLYPDQEIDWLYKKLVDAVNFMNDKYFGFHISHFLESLQFTNYKEGKGFYKKHIDKLHNDTIRKLSLSIQLTDPNEYEGGDLLLYEDEKPQKMGRGKGTLVIFPSYMLHEVTKITKGERNSLVAWVTGDHFK